MDNYSNYHIYDDYEEDDTEIITAPSILDVIKELFAPCKHTSVIDYNICSECGVIV